MGPGAPGPSPAAGLVPFGERVRPFGLWVVGLLLAWSAAWVLHGALDARWPGWIGRDADTLLWTALKVLLWLLPVGLLLRRETLPPLRFLGLDGLRGVGLSALMSLVWIALNWDAPARTAAPDLALLSAIVVAPLFEELVFRGWALHHLCRRGLHFVLANLLTAVAFGLLHLPGWAAGGLGLAAGLRQWVGVVALGLGLGFLRRGRSLWGPILLHLVNNLLSEGLIAAWWRA